jgi:hypothetical protein
MKSDEISEGDKIYASKKKTPEAAPDKAPKGASKK